jgi:prefoldin subunit 5
MDADSPDGRTHQSIQAILNPNAGSIVPIEPSLLALETPEQKRAYMVERKAHLEKEIQRMQEQLDIANAEIQKIDEESAVARAAAASAVVPEN